MSRVRRVLSSTGYYHVIIRGINRQIIFLDAEDHNRFISTMDRFSKATGCLIIVYCLMDNHVHLLLNSERLDSIADFMKRLASSYVFYYNQKYDRVGHLFQDRFKSEPVDSTAYLLAVSRYIIQNPQKAGICDPEDYNWNSWKDICDKPHLCSTQILRDTLGGLTPLKEYLLSPNDDTCLDAEEKQRRMTDSELSEWLYAEYGCHITQKAGTLSEVQIRELLQRIKYAGGSVRQMSRLTGLSRRTVHRILSQRVN